MSTMMTFDTNTIPTPLDFMFVILLLSLICKSGSPFPCLLYHICFAFVYHIYAYPVSNSLV